MNRRTLLTTLLSGLSAGVAAIAGRKTSEPTELEFEGLELGTFEGHVIWHDPEGKAYATGQRLLFKDGDVITLTSDGSWRDYVYRSGKWVRLYVKGGLVDA